MKETLKMALEALKSIDEAMPFPVAKLAIKECKAALEAPQRTWVGLTDEEQQQAYEQWQNEGWGVFYQAIEAKLKEKNT